MSKQFYNWLQTRIAEYEVARDRGYKAYRTRLKKALANRNNGVEPNESESGTLHAPYDGYIHIWWEGQTECEGTYLAGQFLPRDKERETLYISELLGIGGHNFKAPVDRVEKFLAEWKQLPDETRAVIGITRSREFDVQGEEYCYVAITKCPQDIGNAIEEKLMGDIYKLQRYAEEKAEAERVERDSKHESGADVEEGRIVITGEVLAFKWQSSDYGETLKMLVQDDRGFRVWGSVPKGLDDAERNSRISFTATVQQSNDSTKFGFFKRPAKAEILNEVAA